MNLHAAHAFNMLKNISSEGSPFFRPGLIADIKHAIKKRAVDLEQAVGGDGLWFGGNVNGRRFRHGALLGDRGPYSTHLLHKHVHQHGREELIAPADNPLHPNMPAYSPPWDGHLESCRAVRTGLDGAAD